MTAGGAFSRSEPVTRSFRPPPPFILLLAALAAISASHVVTL